MKSLGLSVLAALFLISSPVQATECDQLSTGIGVCLPRYGTDGDQFAQAIIDAFTLLNGSAAAAGSASTSTFHLVYVDTIAGRTADIFISSPVILAGRLQVPNTFYIDGASVTLRGSWVVFSTAATSGHRLATFYDSSGVIVASVTVEGIQGGGIVAGTLDTTKLASDAVTAAKVLSGAITASKIGAGAVETAKIGSDAVTTAAILYENVTPAKVSFNYATSSSKGGVATSASALAANGSNCSAGQYSVGVDASGVAECYTMGTDVALSGTGTATIQAGSVETTKLSPGAVDTTRLNNDAVTTAKIISSAVQTSKVGADAITTAAILNRTITAQDFAAGSVDTDAIATDAVSSVKLLGESVTGPKLAAGAVDTRALGSGSVTINAIGTNAVTAGAILDGTVGTLEIADGSVDTVDITNGAITAAKVLNGAIGAAQLASDYSSLTKVAGTALSIQGPNHQVVIGASDASVPLVSRGSATFYNANGLRILNESVVSNTPAILDFMASDSAKASWRWQTGTTGNFAGSPGNMDDLSFYSLGTGIGYAFGSLGTFYATALSGSGAALTNLSGANIVAGSVDTAALGSGAVTINKIFSGAVDTNAIGSGAVNTNKIKADSVGSFAIISGAIQTAKLAADSVTSAKLLNGAVETGKLHAQALNDVTKVGGFKSATIVDSLSGVAASGGLGIAGAFTVNAGSGTINGDLRVVDEVLLTNSDYNPGTTTGSSLRLRFGATSGQTYSDIQAIDSGGTSTADLALNMSGGSVGIGTASPASTLDVRGTLTVAGTLDTHKITLVPGTDGGNGARLSVGAGASPTATLNVSSATGVMKFATIILIDDATYPLETNFGARGHLTVVTSGNQVCTFAITGSSNGAFLLTDAQAGCDDADTDAKIDVIADGDSTYTLKNRSGATTYLIVQYVGWNP